MTKSFISASFVLALVFASALVFSGFSTYADQGLELRIDSDNNGVIDNSQWERKLAKSPYAFGKFIPYSETDEEFVEFQVVVPKAKSAGEKRSLQFTFESNEVSLWEETPDGKKVCLFKPDVNAPVQTKILPKNHNDNADEKPEVNPAEEENDEAATNDNSLLGLGQQLLGTITQSVDVHVNKLLDVNIDYVVQDEPDAELVEIFKPQTFVYSKPVSSEKAVLTFYLKSEVAPRPADWISSRTIKRPTRTLTAELKGAEQTLSDSAQYMVVGQNSIYDAIQQIPTLSETLAARAVYFSNFDVSKYGLETLDLNKYGVPMEEFVCDSSGFRVQFYRDWIHNKYYLAFKGTDIRLSDFQNDVLLCMGKPSPYLWKALKLGHTLKSKLRPENKGKVMLVGHSLGGALASGACIASQIQTHTFNALGLSYQTLISTVEKYGSADPSYSDIKAQIEKCFAKPQNPETPNDREFITESLPLSTFHTQSDLLTLLELCSNDAKIQNKSASLLVIPSALGKAIEIKPLTGNVPENQDVNLEALRKSVQTLYFILEQCNISNHDSVAARVQKGLNIGNSLLSEQAYLFNMTTQLEYAYWSHIIDAVIDDILIKSGFPESFEPSREQ